MIKFHASDLFEGEKSCLFKARKLSLAPKDKQVLLHGQYEKLSADICELLGRSRAGNDALDAVSEVIKCNKQTPIEKMKKICHNILHLRGGKNYQEILTRFGV